MRARQAIALLALAGAFVALYLTLYKVGVIGQLTCSVGECEVVNTSRWSLFLRMPVAAWGLATYVILLALALTGLSERWSASVEVSRAITALAAWSVCFSAYLTYIELFVLHAVCVWCATSAAIMTLILVAAVIDLRATRAAAEVARG